MHFFGRHASVEFCTSGGTQAGGGHETGNKIYSICPNVELLGLWTSHRPRYFGSIFSSNRFHQEVNVMHIDARLMNVSKSAEHSLVT